jgi:hypothetical protein
MIKHVFNEAFFKGFPLLTYLAIDLEYFGVVNNSWIPKSIGIWNITNNSFVKRIHLLSDNFDALNEYVKFFLRIKLLLCGMRMRI